MGRKKTPNAVVDQFASNVRRVRSYTGLTQEVVAKRTQLHRTEISLLERGYREPRLGTLVRLAGALEVPVEELVADIEWHDRPRGFYVNSERVS